MKVFSDKVIPDLKVIILDKYDDHRGFFIETWSIAKYLANKLPTTYSQDNLSHSKRNVLRGIHFQLEPYAQGKLVGVAHGRVWDVAVDLRPTSKTFGQWRGYYLEPNKQLYLPPGFGHGFVSMADNTVFTYKCTAPYKPEFQETIAWNCPDLNIKWPAKDPLLADKDANAYTLMQWIEINGTAKLEVQND